MILPSSYFLFITKLTRAITFFFSFGAEEGTNKVLLAGNVPGQKQLSLLKFTKNIHRQRNSKVLALDVADPCGIRGNMRSQLHYNPRP